MTNGDERGCAESSPCHLTRLSRPEGLLRGIECSALPVVGFCRGPGSAGNRVQPGTGAFQRLCSALTRNAITEVAPTSATAPAGSASRSPTATTTAPQSAASA